MLVAEGHAYYDAATPEQLEQLREAASAAGEAPAYDGRFRIPQDEAAERLAAGEPAPIRFAVPRPGETTFVDAGRGSLHFDHRNVDDFVILRSDGSPTYHLASTVDDVDFGITHVVRGEDLLPSTPKHILLTRALGAPEPVYAHTSLLMGPDGRKLSKRHGDTALGAYREAGILPEAMVNYLALLGWSPGDDDEVLPIEVVIERFDIGDLSRNPGIFDPAKLEWMNGVYLRSLAPEDFVARSLPLVEENLGRQLTEEEGDSFAAVAPLVQERVRRLTDVASQVRFLYGDVEMDPASWEKVMTASEARTAVESAHGRLQSLGEWTTAAIEAALREMLDELGLSARRGLQPLRVAATGAVVSPPLFESLEALGRGRTLERLQAALSAM
jgi:glutamyl-tRNA synthetase